MITAIMFGSAARRCSGENIIFRYQMTVLVEALFADTPLFEDSRRGSSCGVRELRSSSKEGCSAPIISLDQDKLQEYSAGHN